MNNSYTRIVGLAQRLRRLGLVALLAGGTAAAAQAQTLNYTLGGVSNLTTTYTDLGTTGTAIATATTDDANSAAQPIGFSFSYGGTSFTQFVLNTNGFIKLGSAAPSAAAMYLDETDGSSVEDPFESPNDPNIIAPFNIDLTASGTGATEYRVATTGSAGAHVCTIQWRNVQDKANVNPTQYRNMSFQVKLYEGTNVIELVYAAATAGTKPALRFTQIGLKGSSFANAQLVQVVNQAGEPWSNATFANFAKVAATNFLNTFNIASVAAPDAGRTFRFTPALPNDIAIRAVYTLGKIATPGALPQAVRVNIINVGTAAQSSVPVTLAVTGANTFTITSNFTIGIGGEGTVPLGNLPATLNPGTNIITVSVPTDDNPANNSVAVTQLVTANRLSYIEPSKATDGTLGGFANSTTVFAAKYTVPGPIVLANALISLAAATGNTAPFQVVVYDTTGTGGAPGKLLYSSPVQNRTAAGGDVTIALPGFQFTGSFYVGVKEAGTTELGLATQAEVPLRASTFYYSEDGVTDWTDMANTSLQSRLAIEVGLAPAPSCAAPTGLAVTSTTPTTAVLAFTDASNAGSYQLIYGLVGFQPATEGTIVTATASPATLTGLQPGATYQVYVRTNCTSGGASLLAGPVTFSTGCGAATTIAAFPYAEGFENVPAGQALPCGITVLDANADGATWTLNKVAPYAGVNALRYTSAIANSQAANDWFFTPAFTTAANTRYQLAFRYRAEGIVNSPSNFIERLEVKAGPTPTPAGQTTTLYTNAAITNTSYALANAASAPVVALLQPGAGTQYVGFHVYSAAEQGNLYIDDLSITATSGILATSPALLRAVSVFPNPSTTGVFDLEIHGANAQGGLDVEVVNNLGQRVYAGTARDNFTNRLDLSRLAAGLYHLKVRTGSDYLMRQLSIVK